MRFDCIVSKCFSKILDCEVTKAAGGEYLCIIIPTTPIQRLDVDVSHIGTSIEKGLT